MCSSHTPTFIPTRRPPKRWLLAYACLYFSRLVTKNGIWLGWGRVVNLWGRRAVVASLLVIIVRIFGHAGGFQGLCTQCDTFALAVRDFCLVWILARYMSSVISPLCIWTLHFSQRLRGFTVPWAFFLFFLFCNTLWEGEADLWISIECFVKYSLLCKVYTHSHVSHMLYQV